MDDHKHGEMDISDHEKTFEGFMNYTVYTTVFLIVLIVLMAIFIT